MQSPPGEPPRILSAALKREFGVSDKDVASAACARERAAA